MSSASVRVTVAGAPDRRAARLALQAALDRVEDEDEPVAIDHEFDVPERGPLAVLTARQGDILAAIRSYHRQHGQSPSQRELCALVGLRSTNGLHEQLVRLCKKGYVRLLLGVHRGIRLVD